MGYGTALTFKTITTDKVSEAENYVRNDLNEDLNAQPEIAKILHDENVLALFFGPFVSDRKRFKFYFGEKTLIQQFVAHTIRIVDTPNINDGLGHFAQKMTAKKKLVFQTKMYALNDGRRFFTDGVTGQSSNNIEVCLINTRGKKSMNIDDQRNNLFKKLENIINDFEEKNKIKRVREIKKDFLDVNGSSYDDIKGAVWCCFCHENNLNALVKLYFNRSSTGGRWVLSNLLKHLNNHHLLCKSTQKSEQSTLLKLKVEPCESIHQQMIQPRNFEENSFFENLRDQFSTQMTIQCIKMKNAVLLNDESVAIFEFKKDELKETLEICSIQPDGDCLYASITHQLFQIEINSMRHKQLTAELKKKVLEHIKNNISAFELHLKSRVTEYKEENEIVNLNEEYQYFLDCRLSNRLSWGGSETIKAVTELYKVNILVVDENGSCSLGNHYNCNYSSEYNRSIILLYKDLMSSNVSKNIPNHYDTVVGISDSAIEQFTSEAAKAEHMYQSMINQDNNSAYVVEDSE